MELTQGKAKQATMLLKIMFIWIIVRDSILGGLFVVDTTPTTEGSAFVCIETFCVKGIILYNPSILYKLYQSVVVKVIKNFNFSLRYPRYAMVAVCQNW